jgi:hypothetical protein
MYDGMVEQESSSWIVGVLAALHERLNSSWEADLTGTVE